MSMPNQSYLSAAIPYSIEVNATSAHPHMVTRVATDARTFSLFTSVIHFAAISVQFLSICGHILSYLTRSIHAFALNVRAQPQIWSILNGPIEISFSKLSIANDDRYGYARCVRPYTHTYFHISNGAARPASNGESKNEWKIDDRQCRRTKTIRKPVIYFDQLFGGLRNEPCHATQTDPCVDTSIPTDVISSLSIEHIHYPNHKMVVPSLEWAGTARVRVRMQIKHCHLADWVFKYTRNTCFQRACIQFMARPRFMGMTSSIERTFHSSVNLIIEMRDKFECASRKRFKIKM